nr:MAG TPA: hypothetical protein [Caudoviricetes sp.]
MLCEQFNDIVEIYLIPESSVSLATPFQVGAPTVEISDFSVADAELRKNICFALSVPALYGEPTFTMEMDDPAEVKVTSEKTRAGFQKKVSVTVEISDYSQEVEEKIPEMERKAHHLLMYRSDGRRLFVRCDPFAYICSLEDSSEVKKLQFEISNTNGMQLVI